MHVLILHNATLFHGGGERVVESTIRLLRSNGARVSVLSRSNKGLNKSLKLKINAFWGGIYSLSAYRAVSKIIERDRPDVVHVHNLYPFFSPSVLVACRRSGLPVVLTFHDYRFECPTALHFRKGAVCELCTGDHEYWCMLMNCRGNIYESIGYGLRTAVARKRRLFQKNVTLYIVPTEFVKRRMIDAGFSKEGIIVISNPVVVPDSEVDASGGKYAAYAGRISTEKGIDTLLAAASETGLPVHLAGDYSSMPEIVKTAPKSAQFMGLLNPDQLGSFYRGARFLVISSICFETFGLVAAEAMSQGLPVIASRIGGLPEVVEDGVTGLLFEPGNAKDLAKKLKFLWHNPNLCKKMGHAGRVKAVREYSNDVYYRRLTEVYEKAISLMDVTTC